MKSQLKVLIVEDVPTDAELALRELKKAGIDHTAIRVDTRSDFLRGLEEFAPDIILSDYMMPEFDGISALALAREKRPYTPFILVSGTIGEEVAIESLKRGATDYVLKTNLARLASSVLRAVQESEERAARKRADEALRESEGKYRLLWENTGDAVILMDEETRIQYANPGMLKVFGYAPEEVTGREIAMLQPERLREAHRRGVKRYLESGVKTLDWRSTEVIALHRDGHEFPLEFSISHMDFGVQPLFAGFMRDITGRRLQEEKIARLSRIQKVLSGINSAIVRIHDREDLFREACRIAVEHGGFKLAWIGMHDKQLIEVRPWVWAGHHDGFLSEIRLSTQPGVTEKFGVVGRAIRDKKPVVVNDIANDPRMLRVKESLQRGFRAIVGLPLLVEGEATGVLVLYAAETGVFDQEEMKLLTELAGDISFALEYIGKKERLDYFAYYDPLTALPNRTLFCDRVNQFVQSHTEREQRMAVAALDVDRFAFVNDSLGRQAGDALLRLTAERLQDAIGNAGGLARIGGHTFAVSLPEVADAAGIAHILDQKIFNALGRPFTLEGQEFRLSFKCGIALFPGDGADAETLLKNAAAALNKAKDSGDRYLFYAPQMNARVAEILSLENKLRIAIVDEQFVLHYQPIVDLATNRITGLEALIRWHSPELGLVPPYQFIPILEETGMILEVGMWVLRQAVADQRRWRDKGLIPPRVAVNISSLQLRQQGFVDEVLKVIAQDQDSPPAIDFEITESVIMEDIEQYIPQLKAIKAMGIGIEIDDFGTGYSSLSYIAKLPVTALKIDRSFINEMMNGDDSVTIVSTIISLAHALNLSVVAEGVETQKQRDLLRLLKCDAMQGYLFSKPRPAEEIEALIGA